MTWFDRLFDRKTPIKVYAEEAKSWGTCAVGEAHDIMPNVIHYSILSREPSDDRLYVLGSRFTTAVARKQRPLALRTLL